MRFTPAVVASILAFAAVSLAAPAPRALAEPAYGTGVEVAVANPPAPAPAPSSCSSPASSCSSPGLSKTQQVFLADLVADRYSLLEDADFTFDFNIPQKTPGKGGEIVGANRKSMPALVGTGASMALGHVSPCGINTFHVHQRSVELQMVISGKLVTEMVPENGVLNADGSRRVIKSAVGPNMMTIFPQGSVHTQFNDACEPAVFVAAFASEDAGTGQVVDETFAFGDDLISAVLGGSIAGAEIDRIRAAIPKSIALGVDECLSRCHITKSAA